jgi:hypothetical protein
MLADAGQPGQVWFWAARQAGAPAEIPSGVGVMRLQPTRLRVWVGTPVPFLRRIDGQTTATPNVPRQAPWPLATNKLAALAGLICPLNSFPSRAVRGEPGVFHGDKHDPGDTKSGPPAWWSPFRASILVIGTGRQLPWPLLFLCSAWRRRRIVVPDNFRRTFWATARAGGHHGPPAAVASPPAPGEVGTSLSPGDNYPSPWLLA